MDHRIPPPYQPGTPTLPAPSIMGPTDTQPRYATQPLSLAAGFECTAVTPFYFYSRQQGHRTATIIPSIARNTPLRPCPPLGNRVLYSTHPQVIPPPTHSSSASRFQRHTLGLALFVSISHCGLSPTVCLSHLRHSLLQQRLHHPRVAVR